MEIGLWQQEENFDLNRMSPLSVRFKIKAFTIDDKLKTTTRAFSILSMISSFVSLVVAYFVVVGKFGNIKPIGIGLAFSCCCQAVALSVFAVCYKNYTELFNKNMSFYGDNVVVTLGWSYVLGWVGFAIAGIAGLVGLTNGLFLSFCLV